MIIRCLLTQLYPLFRGLGDETRQAIVTALVDAGGSLSVGDIVRATGLPQSTISRQLAILKHVGLVSSTRAGSLRNYSITVERDKLDALEQLAHLLRQCLDGK
jgi:ArsR family transcriptional regulator